MHPTPVRAISLVLDTIPQLLPVFQVSLIHTSTDSQYDPQMKMKIIVLLVLSCWLSAISGIGVHSFI